MNKKIKFLFLILSLLIMPLMVIFYKLPFLVIIFIILGPFLLFKFPKTCFLILPILFLMTLNLNKLFTFNINFFNSSFDWEKIVITNPDNIKLIDNYWHEDLLLPYKIRNLFYLPWLLGFSWLNLTFKLISPVFLVRIIGYSGFFLLFLGIIEFIKDKNRKWFFCLWVLTVVLSSGLGILVDSKKSMVLAVPGIIYFMYLAIRQNKLNKLWIYWVILFLIDLILR